MAVKRKGRLTNDQLQELSAKGLTLREIAKKDGTTKANVGKKLQRLRCSAVRHVARDEKRGAAIVQHNIDAGQQLTKISFHVNQLLDQATSEEREISRLVEAATVKLKEKNQELTLKEAREFLENIVASFHKDQDTIFKASHEIREQIRLQLDIFKVWYSHQAIQEFQRIVLDALGSVDSTLRDRVIKKLHNKQLVR